MKQNYESHYLPETMKSIIGVKNRFIADVETSYLRLFAGDDALAVKNNYEAYELSSGYIRSLHNSNLMTGTGERLSEILVSKICGRVAIEGFNDDTKDEGILESRKKDVTTFKKAFSEARLTKLLKVAFSEAIDSGRGAIFLNFIDGIIQTRVFNCFRTKLEYDSYGNLKTAIAFITVNSLLANEEWILAEKRYYKTDGKPYSKLVLYKSIFGNTDKDGYEEKEDIKGVPTEVMKLFKDYELYKETELVGFLSLGVYSIDNTLKNKKLKYSHVPESQFIRVHDLIIERDITETQKMTEQHLGRGRALVPAFMNTAMPMTPNIPGVSAAHVAKVVGGGAFDSTIMEQYESKSMDDCKPTSIQFDIRAEQWRNSIAGTVGDICAAFGISVLDFDPRYLQAGQRTDDEINAMTDITASTVQDKRDDNEEVINAMLNQIAAVLGIVTPVFIRWSMRSIMNPTKNEDLIGKQLANGTVSKKTAIKRSNPDYTDEEVEEEYKRIMEERSAAMPMYPSVEDEDTDEDEE